MSDFILDVHQAFADCGLVVDTLTDSITSAWLDAKHSVTVRYSETKVLRLSFVSVVAASQPTHGTDHLSPHYEECEIVEVNNTKVALRYRRWTVGVPSPTRWSLWRDEYSDSFLGVEIGEGIYDVLVYVLMGRSCLTTF